MEPKVEAQIFPDDSIRKRLVVTLAIGAVFTCLILGRAIFIQLMKHPRLEAMASRQYHAQSLVQPRRGVIFDRNGERLAVSVDSYSLAANPTKIRKRWILAPLLAKALRSSSSRLMEKLSEPREFVWIKRQLSEADLRAFKKLSRVESNDDLLEGLWLVKESKRVYPHASLAAHVLGDVNVDSDGLEGVELWQNERLKGKILSVSAIKDALGRPTFIDAKAASQLTDGQSVSLTLDSVLQYEIERLLSEAVRKTGAKGGSVMVMDAQSGDLLALANEPTFDPNQKGIPLDRRRNRVLTDGYEPGSTMKPLLLAAALSSGMKLSDELWGEKGSFILQKRRISEAEAHEKFEWISLKKIIQVSSNVGAAKLALKVGAERYLQVLRAFGLGAKTGSGFPGEISGRIPPKKDWQPLTLANIGFGQGLLVTPMQMLKAYAVFANGGFLVEPHLIQAEAQSKDEKPGALALSPLKKQVLSPQVTQAVVEALESVTQSGGTAQKAAMPGYRIAGKTGTAQVVDPHSGKYSHDQYVSSFIGFPVGLDSSLVIFTALNEPKGVYYASETAVPLFKEVLSALIHRYSLPAEHEPELSVKPVKLASASLSALRSSGGMTQDELHWTQASVQQASLTKGDSLSLGGSLPRVVPVPQTEDVKLSQWVMPDLQGLSPKEVLEVLQGYPFALEMKGMGMVASQTPMAGQRLSKRSRVRLVFSEP
ncbi:MAG: penicillin-binding transpeptidase domain-containing protein [Bdellovibrionia bacterium]